MILAAFTALKMQSISKAWAFIFSMGAGIGLVLILRWFWWRINAWSEITALSTSIIITILLETLAWWQVSAKEGSYSLFGTEPILLGIQIQVHHKLIIIVPLAILSWLIATFITKPEPTEHLRKFYEKVQPGGWWGPITNNFNHTLQPVSEGILVQWVAGIMMIYGFTFGIGNLLFMQYGNSVLLLGCAFIGAFIVWKRSISKLK